MCLSLFSFWKRPQNAKHGDLWLFSQTTPHLYCENSQAGLWPNFFTNRGLDPRSWSEADSTSTQRTVLFCTGTAQLVTSQDSVLIITATWTVSDMPITMLYFTYLMLIMIIAPGHGNCCRSTEEKAQAQAGVGSCSRLHRLVQGKVLNASFFILNSKLFNVTVTALLLLWKLLCQGAHESNEVTRGKLSSSSWKS